MIPTQDQAETLLWLWLAGQVYGVEVDLEDAASPEVARQRCDNDTGHGLATVCTKDGYLCVGCALRWLRGYAGELVSPEVLRLPPVTGEVAA